ncbi:proton channel OtopLc-like [Tubulanus polymorphus]|uniref:proton channel OtopLc-like n=1 Tax=Tubulanus polymorphus TaxID=672921 RepID=UPI003DA1EDED
MKYMDSDSEAEVDVGWDKKQESIHITDRMARTEIVTRVEKEGYTRLGSRIYFLILMSLTVVFAIYDGLKSNQQQIKFHEIYQIALCVISWIMIFCLFDAARRSAESQSKSKTHSTEMSLFNRIKSQHRVSEPILEGKGTSLLFRLGGIFFALGTCAYIALKMEARYNNRIPSECYPLVRRTFDTAVAVFILFQTILLTVCHKSTMTRTYPSVKFCSVHLLSTNLALCIYSYLFEFTEEKQKTSFPGTDGSTAINDTYWTKCYNNTTNILDMNVFGVTDIRAYVFPLVVQYCLYGMSGTIAIQVGASHLVPAKSDDGFDNDRKSSRRRCSCCVWAPGIIIGSLILLLTAAAVVLVFYEDFANLNFIKAIPIPYTFMILELAITFFAVFATGVLYVFLRNVSFVKETISNQYGALLFISQIAVYLFNALIILGAVAAILDPDDGTHLPTFFIVISAANIVQTTWQTFVIADGLNRSAHTDDHNKNKPGRNFVGFAIFCNISLWLSNTFWFPRKNDFILLESAYGSVSWRYIFAVLLPLLLYYRFQSSASFASIWSDAYKKTVATEIPQYPPANNTKALEPERSTSAASTNPVGWPFGRPNNSMKYEVQPASTLSNASNNSVSRLSNSLQPPRKLSALSSVRNSPSSMRRNIFSVTTSHNSVSDPNSKNMGETNNAFALTEQPTIRFGGRFGDTNKRYNPGTSHI